MADCFLLYLFRFITYYSIRKNKTSLCLTSELTEITQGSYETSSILFPIILVFTDVWVSFKCCGGIFGCDSKFHQIFIFNYKTNLQIPNLSIISTLTWYVVLHWQIVELFIHHSFNIVWRQVQNLLQKDSSTQCDLELPPSNESILSSP
jgi:hypothetical protein